MSFENFFKHSLETTRRQYKRLLETPKARGQMFSLELKQIIEQINTAIKCGDVSEKFGKELIKEFQQIDFSNIAKDRIEMKRKGRNA